MYKPLAGGSMRLPRSAKLKMDRLACLGLLATLLLTGCDPALPGRDADGAREYNSRALVAGENVVELHVRGGSLDAAGSVDR